MRPMIFTLCLMFAILLMTGCARQWENPDITDSKQAEYRFDKDSTDCSILAGEQYPLDKDKQNSIYKTCMEKKGWEQQGNDSFPLNR